MKSRRKPSRGLAGTHQSSWLWGRNAVTSMLDAGRWSPVEVWLSEGLPDDLLATVREQCRRRGLEVQIAAASRLSQLCGSREHQGFLARMSPFPYDAVADVIARATAQPGPPLFLVLDGIQDPFNLGSVLRSAEVLGVDGVFLGERHQADVGTHVARSSAGAVNYLPIARTPELAEAIDALRRSGIRLIGASEKATLTAPECNLQSAVALVLGNEGTGLSRESLSACDELVRISQVGKTNSLNVAVAAGILCYEARRQRNASAMPKV